MQISQVGYLSYEKRAPWLLLLPVGGEFFHQHGNPGILINRVMFAIESIECSGGFFFMAQLLVKFIKSHGLRTVEDESH